MESDAELFAASVTGKLIEFVLNELGKRGVLAKQAAVFSCFLATAISGAREAEMSLVEFHAHVDEVWREWGAWKERANA